MPIIPEPIHPFIESIHEELTKEAFFPANGGTEIYAVGDHIGYRVDADNENAFIEMLIPHDFAALELAELIVIALGAVTNMRFDITTDFGAAGELYTAHSDSTTKYQTTAASTIYAIDISGALTGVGASDYVGVKLQRGLTGNLNVVVLGVRLKY